MDNGNGRRYVTYPYFITTNLAVGSLLLTVLGFAFSSHSEQPHRGALTKDEYKGDVNDEKERDQLLKEKIEQALEDGEADTDRIEKKLDRVLEKLERL